MADLSDLAKLPAISRFIERCTVTVVPAGAVPKDVTIQLPDADGAKVPARYTGFPPGLAVNDEVSVRATPQDTIRYMIAWSSGATAKSGGWPFATIRTVSTTDPDADHPTVTAAESAANAGDVIWLDAETFTENITISKSLTICGDNPENTTITSAGTDPTINITADNVTLYGLTVTNTNASTGIAAIQSSSAAEYDNITIRNCIVNRTGAGTPALVAAIWNTRGSDWILDNVRAACTVPASSASSAFRVDGSGSGANQIIGGSYDGVDADILTNRATASVELNDPVLENNILTLTLGSATGQYRDANFGQIQLETAVTAAVTLTAIAFGRVHRCTGTSADYTVTLPTAVGNDGRTITFVMDEALTKFVTLDGNGAQTLNGSTTRKMWAGEVAIIRSDGANWDKVKGKSIPLVVQIKATGSQTIATLGSAVKVTFESTIVDNQGTLADLANERIHVRRDGIYTVRGVGRFTSLSASSNRTGVYIFGSRLATSIAVLEYSAHAAGAFAGGGIFATDPIAVNGDYFELYVFHNSGVNESTFTGQSLIEYTEVPQW